MYAIAIFIITILIWLLFITLSITYTYWDEIINLLDKIRDMIKKYKNRK